MSDTVNTWCQCVKITRQDSTEFGFTTLDKNVTFGGTTYSAQGSYTEAQIQAQAILAVDNSEIEGFLYVAGLTKDDLAAGLFDFAVVEIFILDYVANTKVRDLFKGRLGEVELTQGRYKTEIRSLAQFLQQPIGRSYKVECDAVLGDSKCQVNLALFTDTGEVATVTSNKVFTVTELIGTQSDDWYKYGNLTFTSGLNNGISKEVKDFDSSTGEITTFLPFPFTISAGDTISVYAGCDKRQTTCINKFNNIINFRGFPFIRGRDFLTKGP